MYDTIHKTNDGNGDNYTNGCFLNTHHGKLHGDCDRS